MTLDLVREGVALGLDVMLENTSIRASRDSIAAREGDTDLAPFRLVADAFLLGERGASGVRLGHL